MDIAKFKPTHTYYLEVDLEANQYMKTESGMEFFMPDAAGDIYQSKPFFGTLVAAPKGCTIPKGETVYVMFQAYDTLAKSGGKNYYIVTEDMIIGYGDMDDVKAYRSILVDIDEKKFEKLDMDLSEDNLVDAVINGSKRKPTPTHTGTVLSADNEWLEKSFGYTLSVGDKIEYENGVDWEYFVNHKKHYFIKWADKVIKCNGEMTNSFNELKPRPKYVTRGGVTLLNQDKHYEVVDGKFKDTKVFVEEKRVILKKFIKDEFVLGHLL